MRRRSLMALVGAAVAAWPLRTLAQSRSRPKLGVIMNYAQADREGQARFYALQEQLRKQGWRENELDVEVRWAAGQPNLMLVYATEFVTQPADVIVANSTPLLSVLKPLTTTIPIVFAQVADPMGSGFVKNYAHPGANITGFTDFDTSIGGKWLEILKEMAPDVRQAIVLLDPDQTNHRAFLSAIENAAPALKVQVSRAEVRDAAAIERSIANISGQGHGLIVLPGPINNNQRASIIQSAARGHVPTVYPLKYYVLEGGLLYYGVNQIEQWTKAAGYVDRILRGEKPSDLPVQAPIKFELVINLNTAKTLGLTVPPALLARADEVID